MPRRKMGSLEGGLRDYFARKETRWHNRMMTYLCFAMISMTILGASILADLMGSNVGMGIVTRFSGMTAMIFFMISVVCVLINDLKRGN